MCSVLAVSLWAGLNQWVVPEPPKIAEVQSLHIPDAGYQPGGKECDGAYLAKIRTRGDREKQAAECAEKANESRRNQSDLQQQWRSANAAENTARFAYAQLRMSSIEAAIIFLALCAAAWAAWEARRGNRQDDEQSRRELRAYVGIEAAQLMAFSTTLIEIRLSIKNYGQTPARITLLWGRLQTADHPLNVALDWTAPSDKPQAPNTLWPTGERFLTVRVRNPSPALDAAIRTGKAAIWVTGRVEYIDAYDIERQTPFCYMTGGDWGLPADGMLSNRTTPDEPT